MEKQFYELRKEERNRLFTPGFSVDHGRLNPDRNRYTNVLPWDKSRVLLRAPNDYINASWVHLMGKRYIASQAPLPSTMEHFWQMVLDNNVKVIVMLVQLDHTADRYWPDSKHREEKFGDVTVRYTDDTTSDEEAHYTVRKLTVDNKEQHRDVWHVHYTSWVDFGNPHANSSIKKLIDQVSRLNGQQQQQEQQQQQQQEEESPLLVHCSAGIGRTGTYMALDSILSKPSDERPPISSDLVYQLVNKMREQRPGMVQRPEQYSYILQELKYNS